MRLASSLGTRVQGFTKPNPLLPIVPVILNFAPNDFSKLIPAKKLKSC